MGGISKMDVVYDTGSDWLVVESGTCSNCEGNTYDISAAVESGQAVKTNPTMTDRNYGSASLSGYEPAELAVTYTVSAVSSSDAFQPDPVTGALSIEAENNDGSTAGTGAAAGASWQPGSSSGASTGPLVSSPASLAALPDAKVNLNTGFVEASPRLDYAVRFAQAGTYYLWVRAIGPNVGGDSLHLGLDGAPQATSDRVSGFTSSWRWSRTSRPMIWGAIWSLTLSTALPTPLPPKGLPPSRSSTASCSPVLAPLGTAALPTVPVSVVTSTSTVGLPRESRIIRETTSKIAAIFTLRG